MIYLILRTEKKVKINNSPTIILICPVIFTFNENLNLKNPI